MLSVKDRCGFMECAGNMWVCGFDMKSVGVWSVQETCGCVECTGGVLVFGVYRRSVGVWSV